MNSRSKVIKLNDTHLCVYSSSYVYLLFFFFFQAEDGIRDGRVTGVQTCALPICISLCCWSISLTFTLYCSLQMASNMTSPPSVVDPWNTCLRSHKYAEQAPCQNP